MVEIFANSLVEGFRISSFTGQAIVAFQILGSVLMIWAIIGKYRNISRVAVMTRRLSRDIMGGRDVLEYHLQRRHNTHSPIENIYEATCDRLLKLLTPDTRSLLIGRQHSSDGAAGALTAHEMGLVKSLCEHVLDEEEIRIEKGMGIISTIVALEPMLGLLGTVWGVLDAFAAMGTAGSATIASMAPSISSALVTTVVGLLIAIPGVIVHSHLSGSIRNLTADFEGFSDDLMGRIALEFQGRNS